MWNKNKGDKHYKQYEYIYVVKLSCFGHTVSMLPGEIGTYSLFGNYSN